MRNTVNLFFFNDMEEIRLKLSFCFVIIISQTETQTQAEVKTGQIQVCSSL